jgi:hypothetical protein
MPHNPASIVRLLCGERTVIEKTTSKCFLNPSQQQFDTRPSHRSRPPGRRWQTVGSEMCVEQFNGSEQRRAETLDALSSHSPEF